MYNPLPDLVQLSRVAPELSRELVQTTLALALALHKFCRNSTERLSGLPEDTQLQVEAWQQTMLRAKQAVQGLQSLPESPYQAIVKLAEVFALRGEKL